MVTIGSKSLFVGLYFMLANMFIGQSYLSSKEELDKNNKEYLEMVQTTLKNREKNEELMKTAPKTSEKFLELRNKSTSIDSALEYLANEHPNSNYYDYLEILTTDHSVYSNFVTLTTIFSLVGLYVNNERKKYARLRQKE